MTTPRQQQHRQPLGCGVSSGLEGLEVLPPSARRSAAEVDRHHRGGGGSGGGGGFPYRARVHVATKDLARALAAVAAMNPVRALLGIPLLGAGEEEEGEEEAAVATAAEEGDSSVPPPSSSSCSSVGGHLHIVLAFRDSTGAHSAAAGSGGGGGGVDAAVDLSLRVPAVCDDIDDDGEGV